MALMRQIYLLIALRVSCTAQKRYLSIGEDKHPLGGPMFFKYAPFTISTPLLPAPFNFSPFAPISLFHFPDNMDKAGNPASQPARTASIVYVDRS